MPSWILITLLCLAVVWRWPLTGFAIFLASATPLTNLTEGIIHPSGPILCYLLATVLMIRKHLVSRQSVSIAWTEILCIALTVVVLYRQLELASFRGPTLFIQPILYAMLWAPFLFVVRRLSDFELETLRFFAVLGLLTIGVFPFVGYITGSEYLLDLSRMRVAEDRILPGNLSLNSIRNMRLLTVGVFNYLPFAYWLFLYTIFCDSNITKKRLSIYLLTFVGVWTTVLTSMTRGLLIEMLIGTIVVIWVWRFKSGKGVGTGRQRKKVFLSLVFFGSVVLLGSGLFSGALSEFQGRFSGMDVQDASLVGRYYDNLNAFEYLISSFPVFGAPGPEPRMNYTRSGDPNLLFMVWLYYGFVGLVLFLLIIFLSFARLLRLWIRRRELKPDLPLLACLSVWGFVYVVQMIFEGSYLQQPDVIFLMWFLAEVGRSWKLSPVTVVG